jgi:hypothetical protein
MQKMQAFGLVLILFLIEKNYPMLTSGISLKLPLTASNLSAGRQVFDFP